MASFSSRGLAPALLIVITVLGSPTLRAGDADAPSPTRQKELVRMVRHDCGSCHGMTLQGGLGPALTRAALAQRPLEYVEAMILRGRPGTAMPAWQGLLDADDAQWIARQLKNGFPDER